MAKSERDLLRGEQRRLRCPQCAGEIERTRCMCDWCGAVVSLAAAGDALRLEGAVLDPAWDQKKVTLEDLVLAYLGRRASNPARRLEAVNGSTG